VNRVARWFIFKQTWINFGGSCNGRCWYILLPFGKFSAHLVYLFCGYFGNSVIIWYIFPRFGMLCQDTSGNPDREDAFLSGEIAF
jgi:hypothetical protein